MRKLVLLSLLCMATACAGPSENNYCAGYGISPGHPEYPKCSQYYFEQDALFRADRAVCDLKADELYPMSLYSRSSYYPRSGLYTGFGGWGGHHGSWVGLHQSFGGGYDDDYGQHAEVDRLRMNIIEPCMQQHGWNSGTTWMAGRHSVSRVKTKAKPLPWQPK